MSRSLGMDGNTVKLRGALENVSTSLGMIDEYLPVTRLRVKQARDRSGLGSLLDPALAELDEVRREVQTMKREVASAVAMVQGG